MSFRQRTALSLFLLMLLCASLCAAQSSACDALRGYDPETRTYQYVTFGQYPYDSEGGVAPVLWRVLGPGIPGESDVINVEDANEFKLAGKKYPNEDAPDAAHMDVYCLMSEYIIDMVLYHDVRDEADGPALNYTDAMIYDTLNGEVIGTLFTEQEQSVLVSMPERGLLSVPSRKGELFRRDYGFVDEDFVKVPRRTAKGTPYAIARGLRRIKGNSWYWTTDWRRYGSRWIVGDDGHISVSGLDREGGIRPICYIHTGRLTILGGDGTIENPYQLSVQ